MNKFIVIIAGGAGTRFWPASTHETPKQFLSLGGTDEALIAATLRRVQALAPPSHVLVVTGQHLKEQTIKALPSLPVENVLCEPVPRNTAAAIAYAAFEIERRVGREALCDTAMLVLPADHVVGNEGEFVRVLSVAFEASKAGTVTLGMTPTRPETGYGYIEQGERLDGFQEVFRAKRFVEKPELSLAKSYVASGKYLWNGGIFVFNVERFKQSLKLALPETFEAFQGVFSASDQQHHTDKGVAGIFPGLKSVSVDHGIMEHEPDVLVIPSKFDWNDVGSWHTAWELSKKDELQNTMSADATYHLSSGNHVHSVPGKKVLFVGVQDLIVVDTGKELLVMHRDKAQEVKAGLEKMKTRT